MLQSLKLLFAVSAIGLVFVPDQACAQRGGRPGGGGISADQIFAGLDSDGDGILSPPELAQSRFPLGDLASQNGFDPSQGLSRDDVARIMDNLRQQREAGGGGPPMGFAPQVVGPGGVQGAPGGPVGPGGPGWGGAPPGGGGWGGGAPGGGGGGWGGRGGEGGQGGGNDEQSPGGSQASRSRVRVTVDLPSSYASGDSDGDHQLGLNEWISWKSRSAMREFLALDSDGDGFLTPRELGGSPTTTPVASSTGSGDSNPPQGPDDGPDDASDDGRRDQGDDDEDDDRSSSADSTPAVSLEDFQYDSNSPSARRAANDFGIMDRDDDGKLSVAEWGESRRIRPMFEGANIDLSGNMEQEEFVKTYLWIQSR